MPIFTDPPLYWIHELPQALASTIRDDMRPDYPHDGWYEPAVEDFAAIADIMGVDLDVGHDKGRKVWFSVSYSQGDGACFEGTYKYKRGWRKALQAYAPLTYTDPETGELKTSETSVELHRIGEALQAAQTRHFYALEARVTHSGRYYHSGCTTIDVEHAEHPYRDIGDAEDDIAEALRDLMDWLHARLVDDYEWATGDEVIDEGIHNGEWVFTADGEREDEPDHVMVDAETFLVCRPWVVRYALSPSRRGPQPVWFDDKETAQAFAAIEAANLGVPTAGTEEHV